ncbi:GTP pyrophosphokinase [Corynebacterium qintianiae]|uniref:GTP pyrophosphokinase n=1 Tax=Corynebacterium qintianiae TaxID=2709392 RepID=UPI0020177B89|nr:GTP pyrophosphokinase [Corynebacterium qintianiae]
MDKQAKLWRDGKPYDVDVIDEFLAFNAGVIEELMTLTDLTIGSFIIPISNDTGLQVTPDSNAYLLTSRVKTKATLLQKLRRMSETPLTNIHDIAGIRFDCDLTLTEQTKVAKAFAEGFEMSGAKKVEVKDLRNSPHSGYRAVHLHIRFEAGRAEMQIRTALQSKWANLYEEAADILGRGIRYLDEGESVPPGAEAIVDNLQGASLLVERVEELSDTEKVSRDPEVKKLRGEVYGMLESIHGNLKEVRLEFGE